MFLHTYIHACTFKVPYNTRYICHTRCKQIKKNYHTKENYKLVICGALLHKTIRNKLIKEQKQIHTFKNYIVNNINADKLTPLQFLYNHGRHTITHKIEFNRKGR